MKPERRGESPRQGRAEARRGLRGRPTVAVVWLCLAAGVFGQSEQLLEQAEDAFRSGDLDRAQTIARQIAAKNPGSAPAHMILGVIAAQRRQWDAATKHLGAVVRLAPADPNGYFYLGQAYLYQQKWEQAVNYFARALEKNYPDRQRLGVEMAFAQNEAGRPREALATLEKIPMPSEGPIAAQFHAVRAFAQDKLHQPAAAIAAMRRALELDDSNPQYWELLISSLTSTDQTTAALAEAIRAQSRFPDNPDIQFHFGVASYYVSESPLTKLALRNLKEAEPGGARVLLIEGMLYRKEGKNPEATRAFAEAAKRGVPDAHLLLGILLKEAGDHGGAEREYREAERLNPQNGQVALELGKLLLTRGELAEAVARLEKAEQYMPTHSAVHYQLGLAYGRLGQKQKAEEHLSLYRKLEQEHAELQRSR